jgi:hypothetical protein
MYRNGIWVLQTFVVKLIIFKNEVYEIIWSKKNYYVQFFSICDP